MESNDFDIAITGGTLLTLSANMDIIEDAAIGIRDGRIALVDKHRLLSAKKIIDAQGDLILPGLVNTHTHLPMVCFRGMADDLPLMDWLNHHIFPAEARFINKKTVYHGSMLAMAEMILSGTTTCCDGYFFENQIAEAAQACGMRAVVSQGFADFATPDNPQYEKMMAAADRFVKRWISHAPMITPAFFCHSPYTCSPQTLVNVKTAAREAGILYLTHLLENRDEIDIIEKRYGKKPVRHLLELGVLDHRTIAIHCNWLTPEDIVILADLGVSVSHNPASSMKLAAGVAPVVQMLEKGMAVGLGTDGSASNNDLDMFQEMDLAAKVHKVTLLDPTVMRAETVVKMATIDGARVLGMDHLIGSIEAGKQADIIVLDMNQPHLTPLYNAYSQLVYAARGSDVKTSIINGKIVMENRRLLTIDLQAVMNNVREIAAHIQAKQSPFIR
ncbi:MAG: amidohydrolase [Smithellaceae bacterium]|jgi:5-methylthioadenosine/S-adenosylhomocysteine deaminase|nr:amidohydrolase [Smithella sp. F21]MDD5413766.1 amidohydrolase [Smithellaceae bacterium]HCS78017.1 amidohydrolase [Syntrophaceae bacterium]HCX01143.1 amidohydrolase [Syntrophaceae bacterium]